MQVDYILTPTEVIKCEGGRPKPKGINWSLLTRLNLRKLPVLKKLRSKEREEGVDVTMKSLPRRQRPPRREIEEGEEKAAEGEEGGQRGGYQGRRQRRQRRGSGRRGRDSESEGRRGGRSRRRPKENQSGDESKDNADSMAGKFVL